ncbi:tautomerase family protein [Lichenicola sp.]|uniref:tautomerase family protein n=1 Tax=Lichenicola sp. TaxID=2804529 RepID=UPI003B00531D
MPLLRFDLIEGRTDDEVSRLLDTVHRVVVEAFKVPERDRYQIVHQHKPAHFIVQDTGLGIERSDRLVVISITSRPREQEAKLTFYRRVTEDLEQFCGITPNDVMISITTNGDADWSFGNGRAQFISGDL